MTREKLKVKILPKKRKKLFFFKQTKKVRKSFFLNEGITINGNIRIIYLVYVK